MLLRSEATVQICQKWGWTDSLPFVRTWAERWALPGQNFGGTRPARPGLRWRSLDLKGCFEVVARLKGLFYVRYLESMGIPLASWLEWMVERCVEYHSSIRSWHNSIYIYLCNPVFRVILTNQSKQSTAFECILMCLAVALGLSILTSPTWTRLSAIHWPSLVSISRPGWGVQSRYGGGPLPSMKVHKDIRQNLRGEPRMDRVSPCQYIIIPFLGWNL